MWAEKISLKESWLINSPKLEGLVFVRRQTEANLSNFQAAVRGGPAQRVGRVDGGRRHRLSQAHAQVHAGQVHHQLREGIWSNKTRLESSNSTSELLKHFLHFST